jgi:5-formyltetrahydrofolate cyclo-ligase
LSLLDAKQALRRELRAQRRAFDPARRAAESAVITQQLIAHPTLADAARIHVYLSMSDEVDTMPFIRWALDGGRSIIVPWMNPDRSMTATELLRADVDHIGHKGPLGVPIAPVQRPVADGSWDVVVVPLVGATLTGHRIGNGAGHYDRLLSAWPRPAIGLALSVQIVQSVPIEAHDITLSAILTA